MDALYECGDGQVSLNILDDGDIAGTLGAFDADEKRFVDVAIDELFDNERYFSIKCISYVASPKFLEKAVGGFKDAEVIIGIDDSEVCGSIATGIMKNFNVDGINFFDRSNPELKDKICEDSLRLRFAQNGTAIHTKLYLLQGEREVLTIVGSSNLTENAFGIGKRQFEDIIVSRDEDVYDAYLNRYKTIYESTIDYIPEECKNLWKEESRIADAKEESDIRIEYYERFRDAFTFDTDDYREIKEVYSVQDNYVALEAERTIEIIKNATNPAYRKTKSIKSKNELMDAKPALAQIRVTKGDLDSNKPYQRTELIYNLDENQIFGTRPGIDTGNSIQWERPLDKEKIAEQLLIIEDIVSIYRDHASDSNLINAKKVYEIILHAFFSPFMWTMRRDCQNYYSKGEKNIAAEVANILLINGVGKTGKSAIISTLNKLLQNGSYEIPQWQEYKKDKMAMDYAVRENNIYPLIIDEVEKDFISGSSSNHKGEKWIKAISNTIGGEAHPYMIVASNQSIDLSSPLRRRVNYISLNSKLDGTSEMRTNLSNCIASLDNSLFKDFCYRMLKRMENGASIYKVEYEDKGMRDFIAPAREIFREYYAMLEMDVPEIFPESPFDDYSYNGRLMWRDTFLDSTYAEAFNYIDGELIVNMEEISTKNFSKKANKLKAFLNEYVRTDSNISDSSYLHLDATKFFDWIEVENPYTKKKGFFAKLFA